VRLEVLDRGHPLRTKALLAMIRVIARRRVPDVIKTLLYRPEWVFDQLNLLFQEVMRGSSAWSVGERELMAAYVSKANECEF
jgi:hypothetical protein